MASHSETAEQPRNKYRKSLVNLKCYETNYFSMLTEIRLFVLLETCTCYGSANDKLLKLSNIMSYVNVVNAGQNAEMRDKFRCRKATETSTAREWQHTRYTLVLAKYNEHFMN